MADKPSPEIIIKEKIKEYSTQLQIAKQKTEESKRQLQQMEDTGKRLVGAITGLQELLKEI